MKTKENTTVAEYRETCWTLVERYATTVAKLETVNRQLRLGHEDNQRLREENTELRVKITRLRGKA